MSPNPMRATLFGGAVAALAVVFTPAAGAAQSDDTRSTATPIVVAQNTPVPAMPAGPIVVPDAFRASERGVLRAAAEGNEALRRYIWRTRMIYNYYYNDFAARE